jgi:hypothetical protein
MRLDSPDALRSDRLRSLHDYWYGKRRDGRPPRRADIDPTEIPHLLSDLLMSDVVWHGPEPRFRFRLAGTRFTRFYGEELTGRWLHDLPLGPRQAYWQAEYLAVARDLEVRTGADAAVWQGREHMRFEWLLSPLVDEEGACAVVLGGVHFEGNGFRLPA